MKPNDELDFYEKNKSGQIAILTDDKDVFYYYMLERTDGETTYFRVNGDMEIDSNPYWENDILSDDLQTMDIIYLNGWIANYFLTEKDLEEMYEDTIIHTRYKIYKYLWEQMKKEH